MFLRGAGCQFPVSGKCRKQLQVTGYRLQGNTEYGYRLPVTGYREMQNTGYRLPVTGYREMQNTVTGYRVQVTGNTEYSYRLQEMQHVWPLKPETCNLQPETCNLKPET
jgi:hypothetical protein